MVANGEHREWERKAIQNEHLRVEVLPELGGKISSLALTGEGGEFMAGPLKPYEPRTPGMPFAKSDASGWDECLPTIGPCEVEYGDGKKASLGDHGDIWRQSWTVDDATPASLRMHVEANSLPLVLERALRLSGKTLHLEYTLVNHGDARVPWGWSVHPLFAVEPFDRVILPDSIRQVTASQTSGRLGEPGSTHQWPHTTNTKDGEPVDLSVVGAKDDGVVDKLLMAAPSEGWCAIERKTLRSRLTLRFNPGQWPWLGVWLCYGGWPEHTDGKKAYTVAIEPCNLPVDALKDSLAQNAGAYLEPGEKKQWNLEVEISHAEER